MNEFNIKENLKKLPDKPGVYLHKDKLGEVIYVGKAVSLKNRVRQYFQSYGRQNPKVRAMVSHIAEFEYITCKSEMEALILECNLIKKYMPRYNVLLRDDKTYPYIMVTISETSPRVIKTRIIKKDGNRYFGPYSDVGAVNQIVDLLNKAYKLKTCTATSFPKNFRPCLQYHIGMCRGNCVGKVDEQEYLGYIDEVIEFLSGRQGPMIKRLEKNMMKAADEMKYEEAATYRDYIRAAEAISEVQRVTMVGKKDMDVLLPIIMDGDAYVVLFPVRDGKLSGRELFPISTEGETTGEEVLRQFIPQYYSQWADLPGELIIDRNIEDIDLLEGYLKRQDRSCKIIIPQKGAKKKLLELAKADSIELSKTLKQKKQLREDKERQIARDIGEIIKRAEEKEYAEGLLVDLKRSLGEGKPESIVPLEQTYGDSKYSKVTKPSNNTHRVEAYDISNTNGIDSVGAMVVFDGLQKVKKDYRRFKIKTVEGPDDYGSLQEVLFRRFKRAIDGDPGFARLPDLILMDGGQGQVNAVRMVLKALKVFVPIVGMAKDDNHRTRAIVFGDGEEIPLKTNSLLFSYLGTIQEEVHRFAIDYHRSLRTKSMLKSGLENIKGVGPRRREALLSHFKSLDNIKKASIEELKEVDMITEKVAEEIKVFFGKN